MPSGVGSMSKQLVLSTCHHFNWVQIGGAMQHQDQGKVINMDKAIVDSTNVEDPSLVIYPVNGYGDANILRQILEREQPDAIMHFTDPRFWGWLYAIEHELRQKYPLIYYNIWDDLPYPKYNSSYYECCDLLMGISKQTVNINKVVIGHKKEDWQIQYVPHGINEQDYFPIEINTPLYADLLKKKHQLFNDIEPEFVVFYNSRNIRRKMVPDIILGFEMFLQQLPIEKHDKCFLILHTQTVDDAGTNLAEVINKLAPKSNIILHGVKVTEPELNILYNIADVTINASSAEGWGLGNTESLMAGTMTITNTLGGLQDQSRFVDSNGKWIEFTPDFPSNSCGIYKQCGEWTLPLFPQQNMVGSVPTPYIYDTRASIKDIITCLSECYNMGSEERKRRGMEGHKWVTSDESMMSARKMGENMIKYINILFEKWTPRKRMELINSKIKEIQTPAGVYNPLTEQWY